MACFIILLNCAATLRFSATYHLFFYTTYSKFKRFSWSDKQRPYELNQMYLQNSILTIWQDDNDPAFLWSSTEFDLNSAYRINFSDNGAPLVATKDSGGSAWCIRQF